ncbi:MAG: S41 family peptidase [Candidatus Omnitrophica bacterium]|nr:S41 family peptidase [Candidatus Omnitrophota bacterium]MBI3084003.1 S41 family peptidase [Candidatus Omnitrophota bacterium]
MKRRLWRAGLMLIVAVLVTPMPASGAKGPALSDEEEVYKQLELFEHALSIVRSDYVEQPKAEHLIYGALKGMLATLDPHSQFLDPESYNELKVDTEGQFGGLGIEITVKDDLLTIISPIDDTPAYHAGLLAGDRIVKIDGELTRDITVNDAVKKLRGKPNTKVTLTILREGEATLKDVTLERAIIKIQSVREATVIDDHDHIAYVRLSDFREKTAEDLAAAIDQLKSQAMGGLILDLRNNPGGLLDVAVSVAELFLDRSQVIVSTKGRLRNQNQELRARIDGPIRDVPLVVLINEGSASASEIVAGAVQDHHRGVVLGTKSYGKASVQTIFPLKDGSALRLTTSKYFTPSGRLIEGKGIPPDVEVPFERPHEDAKPKGPQIDELFDQIKAGKSPSATPAPDKKLQDSQIVRAVDLLKGIKVYQAQEKATAVN